MEIVVWKDKEAGRNSLQEAWFFSRASRRLATSAMGSARSESPEGNSKHAASRSQQYTGRVLHYT